MGLDGSQMYTGQINFEADFSSLTDRAVAVIEAIAPTSTDIIEPGDLSPDVLGAWWEADSLGLSDGADIAVIPDLGVGNYDLTLSAGKTAAKMATSQINGKKCILFAGASRYENAAWPFNLDIVGGVWIIAANALGGNARICAGDLNSRGLVFYYIATGGTGIGYDVTGQGGVLGDKYTGDKGQLWTYLFNGQGGQGNTQRARLFRNMREITPLQYVGNVPAKQPAAGNGVNNGLNFANAVASGEHLIGEIYGVMFLKLVPDMITLTKIQNYWANKYYRRNDLNLICAGDSLTQGYPFSDNRAFPAQIATRLKGNYYDHTNTLLGAYDSTLKLLVRNAGTVGATFANNLTNEATSRVDGHRNEWALQDITVIWAGTNGIANSAQTGNQVRDDTIAYAQARRANGEKVIVCTIIDRTDGMAVSHATFAAERATYNTWIRANWWKIADALADFDADSRLQTVADLNYFQNDQVHLTQLGYTVCAEIVIDAINSIPTGAVGNDVKIYDAAYTAKADDRNISLTALTAARIVTLPPAFSCLGREIFVKDMAGTAGANNITVAAYAGELIDGAASVVINANYGSKRVYSNGVTWQVR